jgi:Flp pilus assembly protein protease CpaA
MEWNITAKVILSLVLAGAAAWDLKTRRVPHLVTWPLLLAATALRAWMGSWLLPVFLLALVLVELAPEAWRVLAIVMLVGAGQAAAWMLDDPAARLIVPWWCVVYGLWTLHVLGGADARLFMALLALFPDLALVAALWGGFLVAGVAWLVVVYRRLAWLPLVQAGRSLSGAHFPSLEELKEQGRPTTPGLALGALIYLWLIL